ncbi:hypothetical protein B566_EDAN014881 [Ephemera danica]|nr:hypothetical protein B566_EDAN014881 [Ephemera danica]
MAVLNEELYIGTTWGCIVVAEKNSMRPITVFRPFEEDVRAIVALGTSTSEAENKAVPMVATLGRGYRGLLSRYLDTPLPEPTKSTMLALLWTAGHWAPA